MRNRRTGARMTLDTSSRWLCCLHLRISAATVDSQCQVVCWAIKVVFIGKRGKRSAIYKPTLFSSRREWYCSLPARTGRLIWSRSARFWRAATCAVHNVSLPSVLFASFPVYVLFPASYFHLNISHIVITVTPH